MQEFPYLGAPVFARNAGPARIPFDQPCAERALGPLASVLLPRSATPLHLKTRVLVLRTMVESKLLHNAPLLDFDYAATDRFVNKWLAAVSGCCLSATRATFLRCELGVFPSQVVAERDALYFLWHLQNLAWFRESLPALTHLQPLERLTSLTLKYGLGLSAVHRCSKEEWRSAVRDAVEAFADRHFAARPVDWLPDYHFERSRQYLKDKATADLGDAALHLRNDRLPTAPQPWVYHPCPFCQQPRALNGAHLLSCPQLPPHLDEQRRALHAQAGPHLSLSALAARVVYCSLSPDPLRRGLVLGRRVSRAAVRALRGQLGLDQPGAHQPAVSDSDGAATSDNDADTDASDVDLDSLLADLAEGEPFEGV